MRILIHDYAGHPFQAQLSRALARSGHEVRHAFAESLQTPRGELGMNGCEPETFSIGGVPMDTDYARYKYAYVRRRGMEIRYGREVGRLVERIRPDAVLSANTPTESQEPIVRACRRGGSRFFYWAQDFYSVAVEKILRRKLGVAGRIIGAYYRRLERRQLRRSDGWSSSPRISSRSWLTSSELRRSGWR